MPRGNCRETAMANQHCVEGRVFSAVFIDCIGGSVGDSVRQWRFAGGQQCQGCYDHHGNMLDDRFGRTNYPIGRRGDGIAGTS